MENKYSSAISLSPPQFDEATLDQAARAVAALESWDGWDTNAATPNGNTPDEQRAWCREIALAVLQAAAAPTPPVPVSSADRALELLRQYRAAPKFSNDHAAIKKTVALEDQIDTFLGSLDSGDSPKPACARGPKR